MHTSLIIVCFHIMQYSIFQAKNSEVQQQSWKIFRTFPELEHSSYTFRVKSISAGDAIRLLDSQKNTDA